MSLFQVGDQVMTEFDVATVVDVIQGNTTMYIVRWPNGDREAFEEGDGVIGSRSMEYNF